MCVGGGGGGEEGERFSSRYGAGEEGLGSGGGGGREDSF